MAVAGFSEKDRSDNMLTIEGNRTHDHTRKRRRAFIQSFVQTIVQTARICRNRESDLNIGILSVFLKRNLPEAKKPRIIKIQKVNLRIITRRCCFNFVIPLFYCVFRLLALTK